MDGRKAVGGKLEVKVRLRNPIVTKQVEEVTEKWLVIDRVWLCFIHSVFSSMTIPASAALKHSTKKSF